MRFLFIGDSITDGGWGRSGRSMMPHAILVDYETMFNALTMHHPSYWIWDGIQPTAAGHQRMADLWLKEV